MILESELVSGFMTEHAAVIFVFFFLAEYASIVLICILISILFIGGYLSNDIFVLPLNLFKLLDICFVYLLNVLNTLLYYPYLSPYVFVEGNISMEVSDAILSDPIVEGIIYGLTLGLKTCIMIFVFIWVRASFPRIRFDQLMSFCWTILLPLVISFIIGIPCLLYSFEIIVTNAFLL